MMRLLTLIAAACLCSACGSKGPLVLPPGPAPAPVFGPGFPSGNVPPVDVSMPTETL